MSGERKILILSPMFGASRIYYSELLEATAKGARKYGFQVLIQPVDLNRKQKLSTYYSPLSELDGIIAITCQVEDTDWLSQALSYGIPVVLIHDNISLNKLKNSSVVSSIKPDLSGLISLVEHLVIDNGSQNISVVMVSPQNHEIRERKFKTILDIINSHNLNFTENKNLFIIPEYTVEQGEKILTEILKTNPSTDTIISLSDTTAVGLKKALSDRKRNDILLTGFDNISLAEEFDITSVDQQLKITGETALSDINNAIKHKIFSVTKETYIPTTLVRRTSCCKPELPEAISSHPLPRFVLYYNVSNAKVIKEIDKMRVKIYDMKNSTIDTMTTKFLGRAPLYPLHITLRGEFQIRKSDLNKFLKDIRRVVQGEKSFTITAGKLINYPKPTFLSFGFNDKDNKSLQSLQRELLKVVNKYRNTDSIEPEFRKFLYSDNKKEKEYTLKNGTPFIDGLFIPHVSLISGVQDEKEYNIIKTLIEEDFDKLKPLNFKVDKISVLYETTLGGKWEILAEYFTKSS